MTTVQAPPFDKWEVLDAIGWDPHAGQLAIAEDTTRNRVVSAGRRFGKSDVGGHELVPEALYTATQAGALRDAAKRREFWIVGPEYSDAEKEFRVVYNELSKLEVPFDRPGTYNDPESGNLHISAWRGTFQVHGKSAKYPTSLVGEGLSGVIMAEAAKLKERVWTKFIRPTLADFRGWALFTSTPEGKNWFYEYWLKGQDPKNWEWSSYRMPAWLNPYVYREPTLDAHVKMCQELAKMSAFKGQNYWEIAQANSLKIDPEILSLMMSMTESSFNQEIGAGFEDFVGKVFKEWDEEVHVRDLEYNPAWETYAAVDYGFTNPNVWLLIQVGPWSEVHVLDEVYEHGLTANEFAALIKERGVCPDSLIAFYPDPSSPGDTRILENKLRKRARSNTGGDLNPRLNAIRQALKEAPLHVPRGHKDRRPQLWIDRKCKMTIHDMGEYRYPDKKDESSTKQQELPMKKDDHGPEALGRFFKGYFGVPEDVREARRTKKANYTRGGPKKEPPPPPNISGFMKPRV